MPRMPSDILWAPMPAVECMTVFTRSNGRVNVVSRQKIKKGTSTDNIIGFEDRPVQHLKDTPHGTGRCQGPPTTVRPTVLHISSHLICFLPLSPGCARQFQPPFPVKPRFIRPPILPNHSINTHRHRPPNAPKGMGSSTEPAGTSRTPFSDLPLRRNPRGLSSRWHYHHG